MACCIGAEHSNWCAEYDIRYVDAQGKEYCIFHAPAEHKYVSKYIEGSGERPALMEGDDFNELVFDRIRRVIAAGEDEEADEQPLISRYKWDPRCNFAGTVFPFEISFDKFTNLRNQKYMPPICFNSCYFNTTVDFWDVKFKGMSSFKNTIFKGDTIFWGAHFQMNSDFSHAQIHGEILFIDTYFAKEANFNSTFFEAKTSFELSCCNKINLRDAEARQKIHFNDATFVKSSFDGMTFNAPVFFDGAWFLNQASFKNTVFNDYSNFESAEFYGKTEFHHSLFKEWTYFRNVIFNEETSFAGTISKETILIESANLEKLSLTETNIESFKFIECTWDKDQNNNDCIIDEKNDTPLCKLEEIYRRLKKISKDSANEMQASNWHFKEKEMQLKQLNPPAAHYTIILIALFTLSALFFNIPSEDKIAFTTLVLSCFCAFPLFSYWKENKPLSKKDEIEKLYMQAYYTSSGFGEKPGKALLILLILLGGSLLTSLILDRFMDLNNKTFQYVWLAKWLWYLPVIIPPAKPGACFCEPLEVALRTA